MIGGGGCPELEGWVGDVAGRCGVREMVGWDESLRCGGRLGMRLGRSSVDVCGRLITDCGIAWMRRVWDSESRCEYAGQVAKMQAAVDQSARVHDVMAWHSVGLFLSASKCMCCVDFANIANQTVIRFCTKYVSSRYW